MNNERISKPNGVEVLVSVTNDTFIEIRILAADPSDKQISISVTSDIRKKSEDIYSPHKYSADWDRDDHEIHLNPYRM